MTGRRSLALAAVAAICAKAVPVSAQGYPAKPVRLVVPFGPGGGTDLTARIVAEALTGSLGQNVIVENKPGASSQIGIEQVVRAAKDGYTLLWASSDGISILPAVKRGLQFKVPDSFGFVSSFASYPLIVGVNAKLGTRTMTEFAEYGRGHPGKLRYASSGAGGGGHLEPAYIAKVIGTEMAHVPYDAGSQAATAVAGGFADLCTVAPSSINAYVTAGTVNALATTGRARSALMPDVPTVAELGFPQLTVDLMYGMFAPAGTPPPILEQLRNGVEAVLKKPATPDRLHALGLEPLDLGGDAFRDFVVKDMDRWRTVADLTGIHLGR